MIIPRGSPFPCTTTSKHRKWETILARLALLEVIRAEAMSAIAGAMLTTTPVRWSNHWWRRNLGGLLHFLFQIKKWESSIKGWPTDQASTVVLWPQNHLRLRSLRVSNRNRLDTILFHPINLAYGFPVLMVLQNESAYIGERAICIVLTSLILICTLILLGLVIKFNVHEIQASWISFVKWFNILFVLSSHF